MNYPIPKELLNRIIADGAKQVDVEIAAVQIVRMDAVTWNDGSLGCPLPGMLYTQQLVEGYWVQLEIEGEIFDYRATKRGDFRRCREKDALPGTPSLRI